MEHVHEDLVLNSHEEKKEETRLDENKRVRGFYYLIGGFLLLFSGIFLYVSMNMELHSRTHETITPASFPTALSVMLVVLGIVLIIQTARKKYDHQVEIHPSKGSEEENDLVQNHGAEKRNWRNQWGKSPLVFMVLTVMYLFLIPQAGFFVTSAVYILFGLYLIEILSWMKQIMLTAGLLLFAYFVFVDLLLIRLPVGPWGF